MKKLDILGVPFDRYTRDEYHELFKERILNHKKTMVVTANPEIVMAAQENPQYMKLLNETPDFIVPDGIGIVYASKWLKEPLKDRVPGYELFTWMLSLANEHQLRVYFIGAKPEVIADLEKKVATEYPQLVIAGIEDGYFKEDLEMVARRIKQAKPDLVFAAVGFPKQDQLLAKASELDVPALMMGVGGSFDVFSGHMTRAPKTFQKLHLEWLYRVLKEPSRLPRMMALPRFVLQVKKEARKRR
ncbi:MAG: WecB/TagA/CpsF family glycosyltransferase [Lactobacillus sp.]|nr:WecB/TagA/CpsF family glycosyltransferase [Lactobacillus sp.]